ncbi:hypothetical protein TNCV_2858161 [Trichonephila clavipes]|nr:hypothetical protein TNCV_2858161 [Trichonephila clavipes]
MRIYYQKSNPLNTGFSSDIQSKSSKVFTPSTAIKHNLQRLKIHVTTRRLLTTDSEILNHGQVIRTTPELAPPSHPNFHTTPTGGRLNTRQIKRASPPTRRVFSGTTLELMTRRYLDH